MAKNKVQIYPSKRVKREENYEKDIAEERQLLAGLVDSDRKNCQVYDNGSRRSLFHNVDSEAPTSEHQVVRISDKSEMSLYKKVLITGGIITGAIIGTYFLAKGCNNFDQAQENYLQNKENTIYEKMPQDLKEIYKDWEREASRR